MNIAIKIARCAGAGYTAWCPALPGCAVRAKTREQAQRRIRDAVAGYLASMDVALPRELSRQLETRMQDARPTCPTATA